MLPGVLTGVLKGGHRSLPVGGGGGAPLFVPSQRVRGGCAGI